MKTEARSRIFSRRTLLGVLAAALTLITVPVLVAAAGGMPLLAVSVNDTIRGETENIAFSGRVTIAGKFIDDPEFRSSRLLQLVIDFSGVKGRGLASGKLYVTSAQAVLHRPLLATDPIQATFPYYPSNNPLAARAALATFSVTHSPPAELAITSKLTAPSF